MNLIKAMNLTDWKSLLGATGLVLGLLLCSLSLAQAESSPPASAAHPKKSHAAHASHKTKVVPPGIKHGARRTNSNNRAAMAKNDLEDFDARWGCIASSGKNDVIRLLGLHDEEMSRQITLHVPELYLSATPCIPYSVLVNDQDKVLALSIAWYKRGDNNTRLETFTRALTEGSIEYQTQALPYLNGSLQLETFSLQDAIDQTDAVKKAVPNELHVELAGLAAAIANSEEGFSHPDGLIQVLFDDGNDEEASHLISVTLIDKATGQDLGQALWVERDNLPGGFFTPAGESLERQFWTNPVSFTRISRGVGPARTRITMRSRVVKKVNKKTKIVEVRKTVVRNENHIGVDFAAPKNTPVLAVADGKVVFAANYAGYGNLIILEHPGGYTTHYGHLNAFDDKTIVGTTVHRGQVIGYVGSTGLSTGFHLHYEIRLNGNYLDPMDESQPLALWNLRRVDYAPLTRRMLLSATSLLNTQERRSTHFSNSDSEH